MTTNTTMTVGEWDSKNYKMQWSIYDRESYNAFDDKPYTTKEQWKTSYDAIVLDLRAPDGTPDGIHKVRHRSGWQDMPQEGVSVGALVKNGLFLPDPTQATVFEAVCKSYNVPDTSIRARLDVIDHVYIEKFKWDPEWGGLEVTTGS